MEGAPERLVQLQIVKEALFKTGLTFEPVKTDYGLPGLCKGWNCSEH